MISSAQRRDEHHDQVIFNSAHGQGRPNAENLRQRNSLLAQRYGTSDAGIVTAFAEIEHQPEPQTAPRPAQPQSRCGGPLGRGAWR